MLNRYFVLFLMLLPLMPSVLRAQETQTSLALTLSQALSLAEEQNTEIILADERARQAVSRLGQASSALLPHADFGLSSSRQTRNLAASGIKLPQTPSLIGPFNSWDARFAVTQSLFDGESIARLMAARSGKKAAKSEKKKTRQDVLAFVANLYIEGKRAAEKKLSAQALFRRDREQWVITETRFREGSASRTDYLASRSVYLQSAYQYQQAAAEAEEKKMDLLAALGMSPGTMLRYHDQPMDAFPFDMSETAPASVESLPEFEEAKALVSQRKSERWAELLKWFPKISGLYDYGASGISPGDSENTYTIGLKATLPLFEGGDHFFKAKEATSRLRASEAELKDKKIRLEGRVLNAIQQLRAAQALIQAKEAELQLLKQELGVSRVQFNKGVTSHLELSQTRASRALIQDERWEALALYAISQVQLAHAVGRMDYFLDMNPPVSAAPKGDQLGHE